MDDFDVYDGKEGPFKTPQPGVDPQEQLIAAQVIKRWRQAKRDRKEIATKWRTHIDYFLGKQRSRSKEGWAADIVVNYVFGMVETTLPLLTDGRPRLQILPTEQRDVDKVQDFEDLINFYWNKEEVDKEIERIALFGLIFGTGIGKAYWDREAENGMGEARVEILSPYYFFIDPAAEDIQNAKWVIHAEPRTVDWIRDKYQIDVEPDFETDGPADEKVLSEIGVTFTDGYSPDDATRVDEGHTVQDIGWLKELQSTGGFQAGRTKKAVVVELWEKTTIPQEMPIGEPGPNGQPAETITIPVQVIVKTVVLGVKAKRVLPPEPQPPGISLLPFFSFPAYKRPGSFWGIGDVENLIPLQNEYNKRKAQLIEMFALMCNGRILIPIECDVDPDSLTNEPGEIIPYVETGGHKPSLMFPMNPPNAIFKHQEEIKKDLEAVAGIYDVTQGRTPGGIQAASAIANLQEAGQTRIRLKSRHLENCIRDMGRILLEFFTTYYKATRWIRIVGDAGQPVIKAMQMQEMLGDRSTIKFDVQCESGLTIKMTRDERDRKTMEWLQAGIIDDIAALELLDVPKKDAIIQRKHGIIGIIEADPNLSQILLPGLEQYAQALLAQFQQQMAMQEQQNPNSAGAPQPSTGRTATSSSGSGVSK